MTHKIIQTENYLLIVDDSEIKEGDYYLFTWYGEQDIQRFQNQEDDRIKHQHLYETACKKIIAHLPLNGSSILDGVDLLPPLEDDEAICPYPEEKQNAVDWHNGYNKAKERFKYIEEDILLAMDIGFELGKNFDEDTPNIGLSWLTYQKDHFIQSLQQPKMPIKFKCEVNETQKPYDESGWMEIIETPKTITNSQGIQWVGKYIFE